MAVCVQAAGPRVGWWAVPLFVPVSDSMLSVANLKCAVMQGLLRGAAGLSGPGPYRRLVRQWAQGGLGVALPAGGLGPGDRDSSHRVPLHVRLHRCVLRRGEQQHLALAAQPPHAKLHDHTCLRRANGQAQSHLFLIRPCGSAKLKCPHGAVVLTYPASLAPLSPFGHLAHAHVHAPRRPAPACGRASCRAPSPTT